MNVTTAAHPILVRSPQLLVMLIVQVRITCNLTAPQQDSRITIDDEVLAQCNSGATKEGKKVDVEATQQRWRETCVEFRA
jgi:hypothetical protein